MKKATLFRLILHINVCLFLLINLDDKLVFLIYNISEDFLVSSVSPTPKPNEMGLDHLIWCVFFKKGMS